MMVIAGPAPRRLTTRVGSIRKRTRPIDETLAIGGGRSPAPGAPTVASTISSRAKEAISAERAARTEAVVQIIVQSPVDKDGHMGRIE